MAPRQHSPLNLSRAALGALAAAFLVIGCAPEPVEPTKPGSGGSSNPASGGAQGSSGGAPGTGGASSGGAPGSGGSSSGGASGTGGRGTGGGSNSGGASGTGGRGTGGGTASGGSGTATGGSGSGTGGKGTGGGGAATGGSSGGGSSGTFTAAANIFGMNCGTGQCHQGGAHVDLRNTPGLRDRIVSKMVSGTNSMMSCRTKTYVVPNDTANSVISQIIKAAVTGCGARMPDDCSTSSATPRRCLTNDQIATIDAWIMAGAPP